MRILSREHAEKVLDTRELYEGLRRGFALLAQGQWKIPLRTAIEMTNPTGVALFMPSYCAGLQAAGLKLVTVMQDNPARNLPLIHTNYLYVSAETGQILAVMDAEYLTAMRTAATSALVTELCNKHRATTLAVFGTGVQASSHARVFTELFGIKRIFVFGLDAALSESFAARLRAQLGVEARPGTTADLRTAEIICTCTTSAVPLFALENVHPAVHINAVGAYRPTTREIGTDVVSAALMIVDSYEGVLHEAGEFILAAQEGAIDRNHVFASIDELVSGARTVQASGRVSLFKSVGLALEDLIAADIIYRKAIEAGVGTTVSV